MTRLIACVAALALAAPVAAAPRPANPYSARLARLPEIPRRAALRNAVLNSGEYCKRVEADAIRGPFKNLMMWQATCDRGAAYGVFIGPDGSVQVRPCADLPKLRLPRCR